MRENKILHVMISEKFMPSFIDFVDKHFGRENHHYVFITSEKYEYGLTKEHNVEFLHTDEDIFVTLLSYMQKSSKIILHGLWRDKVDKLLVENPTLFKKCYWVMWGGDYYYPKSKSENRKEVIKNVGYLLNVIPQDFESFKSQYKSISGEYIRCFIYVISFFEDKNIKEIQKENINILVGNSSAKTNNHEDIFAKLEKYKTSNIKLFTPLSYGDSRYGMGVMKSGYEKFGEKFHPMIDFIEKDEYAKFLSSIDIAIFAHERQQAFLSIVLLVWFGKKVYVNPKSPIYRYLQSINADIYDFNDISLEIPYLPHNKSVIEKYFSHKKIKSDLENIFNKGD